MAFCVVLMTTAFAGKAVRIGYSRRLAPGGGGVVAGWADELGGWADELGGRPLPCRGDALGDDGTGRDNDAAVDGDAWNDRDVGSDPYPESHGDAGPEHVGLANGRLLAYSGGAWIGQCRSRRSLARRGRA